MNKNEQKVEEIYKQERKLCIVKGYLGASFFLAAVITLWIVVTAFISSASDPLLVMEHSRLVAVRTLITLSTFTAMIIAGYIYNDFLSRKLSELWEEKTLFLNIFFKTYC